MTPPALEHRETGSDADGDSSYEDRRRAAGEANGCGNVAGIAFLGLWSAFFIPVSAFFFLDMLQRAGRGAFGGSELIGILALLEFDIPMLLGWWMVAQSIRARPHPPEAGALLVVDRGDSVELREQSPSPAFMGLLAVLGANFVLLFVIGISFGQQTPLPVALAAWMFNLIVFVAATCFAGARLRRLSPLLRLDLVSRVATFRPVGHGESPCSVPMAAVKSIDTELKMVDNFRRPTLIAVRLHVENRDLNMCPYPIVELASEVQAKVCVQWLSRKFGLDPVDDQ